MRRVALLILRLIRWRMVGEAPARSCVLIGAPHTSNWDFVLALLAFWSLDLDVRWVGKHTIFRRPFGGLMRRLGGIPLDRGRTKDFVPEVVSWFDREEALILAIAPEGTRSRLDHWRTGFYWIAHGARVPIALGFLDYRNRVGGIGGALVPTGDIEVDMAHLREFYGDKTGRHPDRLSPIETRPRPAAPAAPPGDPAPR